MENEYQNIKIVGVDHDKFKVSSDRRGFWEVNFKLSQKPDPIWERKFYEVREQDSRVSKIKCAFVNEYFTVEIAEDGSLQDILDVLKKTVNKTNAQCLEDYQKKMKIRQDISDLKKKEENIRQNFKDDADKLNFE